MCIRLQIEQFFLPCRDLFYRCPQLWVEHARWGWFNHKCDMWMHCPDFAQPGACFSQVVFKGSYELREIHRCQLSQVSSKQEVWAWHKAGLPFATWTNSQALCGTRVTRLTVWQVPNLFFTQGCGETVGAFLMCFLMNCLTVRLKAVEYNKVCLSFGKCATIALNIQCEHSRRVSWHCPWSLFHQSSPLLCNSMQIHEVCTINSFYRLTVFSVPFWIFFTKIVKMFTAFFTISRLNLVQKPFLT